MAVVALFVGTLISGCASPTYDFKGDWTAEEKTAVMNGITQWPATPGHVRLVRVTDQDPNREGCNDSPDVDGAMLGATYQSDSEICFWADRITRSAIAHGVARGDLIEQTAAHETGHFLGLGHSAPDSPPSIMRAERADAAIAVTAFDLATLNGTSQK